ncbi:MAG: BatD family protein [Bdellovibrionaceae bacterium]|nr:BatD family protein [Pseudobdellovibrionaceae bacterium]
MKIQISILASALVLAACATTPEPKPAESATWQSQLNLNASVDKPSVEVGESFELNLKWTLPVTIENRDPEPKLPDLKEFERLGDSSHVSKGFFIGERLHWTYTRTYSLSSKKAGKFTIGPAEISVQGETFRTSPVNVEVTKETYKDFLKTNKCEKQFWSRYAVGEQYHSLAAKNKVSPYDLAFGDDHTLRNVSVADRLWATSKFVDYLSELPEPLTKKYNNAFASESATSANKKSVFNMAVRRDHDCHAKLK